MVGEGGGGFDPSHGYYRVVWRELYDFHITMHLLALPLPTPPTQIIVGTESRPNPLLTPHSLPP